MDLTQLDKELLDGLRVLTDQEIGRVQAHLAAGLPMILNWGWGEDQWDSPAVCGCLVGVAMSKEEGMNGNRRDELWSRTSHSFIDMVYAVDPLWGLAVAMNEPIREASRAHLAALLDLEWTRRSGGAAVDGGKEPTAESLAPSPIPSLEAVPA